MSEDPYVHRFLELLRDEDFCNLRRALENEIIMKPEFSRMRMPQGYTVDETWEILTEIRKQTAYRFPFKSFSYSSKTGVPLDSWYTVNKQTAGVFTEIEVLVGRISRDINPLLPHLDRHVLADFLAADLFAASIRDGLGVPIESIKALVLGQAEPSSPQERLIKNAIDLLVELKEARPRTLSPWFIDDCGERIEYGCRDLDYRPRKRASYYERMDWELTPNAIPNIICDIANQTDGGDFQSQISNLVYLSSLVWDFMPFPRWNGMLEVVVRRIAYAKRGFAVLGSVPFSNLILEWENGTADEDLVPCAFTEADVDKATGYDASALLHGHCNLILHSLKGICDVLEEESVATDTLSRIIEQHPFLNHRQKQALTAALQNPQAPLVIKEYKESNGIAYATARSDLLQLKELGLLELQMRNREFSFMLADDFASMITGLLAKRSS